MFMYNQYVYLKDAGFVYESFRIKTNRVIWDFWPYELNPRYKSFEKRYTNQIHDTNLMNTIWIRESKAQDSYGFVLDLCTKIREDS